MKKSLYLKFIFAYAILALLFFFIAATLGPQLFQDRLVSAEAESLYSEAVQIASQRAGQSFSKNSSLQDLYTNLKMIAVTQDSDIRIINTSGVELINTSTELKTDSPDTIAGFDYTSFGPHYYEISTFFGQYSDAHLNVMVPITVSLSTKGYVSIHCPMDRIYAHRDALMGDLYTLTLIFFLLSLGILAYFTFAVYRPMGRITDGAREISAGHYDHRIEVTSNDEMGALAESLNNMADDIQKTGEYQKKFISNVSHDFRSPLTSIKGFTEAMTDGTIPPEMHEKYLRIISSEADRLEKLTHDTLTLNTLDSRTYTLELTDFDINRVIRNTAAVFEGSCREKKISFELLLLGEKLSVRADKGRIQQVLYNLIDNAIKFSERDSTIHLETSIRHGKCAVSVKDEGCGISRENLNKIWDRFYKTDASRGKDKKGTGLGLSIVKEILNMHGEDITVTSTEGIGTRFTFTLELSRENVK
jgi:signal transduction histidine kinase